MGFVTVYMLTPGLQYQKLTVEQLLYCATGTEIYIGIILSITTVMQ